MLLIAERTVKAAILVNRSIFTEYPLSRCQGLKHRIKVTTPEQKQIYKNIKSQRKWKIFNCDSKEINMKESKKERIE